MTKLSHRKGVLEGSIMLVELPPYIGYLIDLSLFPVCGRDFPPPYAGNPPPDAFKDTEKIAKALHFGQEVVASSLIEAFSFQHEAGFYYVDVGVTLFRKRNNSVFGQLEHFFFPRQPIEIICNDQTKIKLPITWPSTPLSELHAYGKFEPRQ